MRAQVADVAGQEGKLSLKSFRKVDARPRADKPERGGPASRHDRGAHHATRTGRHSAAHRAARRTGPAASRRLAS